MDSAHSDHRASEEIRNVPSGAAYNVRTILRHRHALPVMAAGVAGTIAAATIIFLPDWRLERLAWDLYLDKLTDAARPPFGLKARFMMALAAGVSAASLTGLLAYATARFSGRMNIERTVSKHTLGGQNLGSKRLGSKTMGLSLQNWKFWDRADKRADPVDATPHVRRRDFHPDAPAPRPVNAHAELGAPLPPLAEFSAGPVGCSPLAQKSVARVAAVLPDTAPVDWSTPDDVLDLGTALTLTEEEQRMAPVIAATAAPGASGIEYPTWAYEEGQRMAAEDPDYAAKAVELARRIHLPTPPEEMPCLPPEIAEVSTGTDMPVMRGAGRTVSDMAAPDWSMDAKLSDYADVPASAPSIEQIYATMHAEMAPHPVVSSALPDPIVQAPAMAVQAQSSDAAYLGVDASIDAMIDRLERALAHRPGPVKVGPAHILPATDAPYVLPGSAPLSGDGDEQDPALDAALSTLARMNRQAYG